jgi:hypothetical protein
LPGRIVFLPSDFRDDEWVNDRECLIRIEAEDSEDEGVVTVLYFAKVEKANFGTGEQVLINELRGVNGDLVSGSASSTGDDGEFVFNLKPFIGMAMPTEK